jgi:hypothetical protein
LFISSCLTLDRLLGISDIMVSTSFI